ncbi:FMN-binding negative transcriptional regulator [Aestuariimicrobium ganziense]|uniref:FMN-binding negative transcriptional regulator n=1 Tax=Aestuariimicrobium ganziense TaxID=2773677 RepID=UPI0019451009|nr:FMN-binding negative transcriptional regulator [Aestuariimicrobium ganziense]
MTRLYIPRANQTDQTWARELVGRVGLGQLVTVADDGTPDCTVLPLVWTGDRVLMHLARANEHWRRIAEGSSGLITVLGPHGYISPTWYPTKAEHGRVVPTWNYSTVQLRGPVTVHRDEAWLRKAVTLVTDLHEGGRADRWQVSDAPEDYITKSLRVIVGVEMQVETVEAKAKASQNRTAPDRDGIIARLTADGVDPTGLVEAPRQD